MKKLSWRVSGQAGVSLMELVVALVVIGILATLTAPLINTWRIEASKRTCVSNQAAVQSNMRAYAGFNNLNIAANLASTAFIGTGTTHLMPPPRCAMAATAAASYTFLTAVPATGVRYATCTPQSATHVPDNTDGW